MLTNPAISKEHIAFVYDRDIWIAKINGSGPRRLTTHAGIETNPAFTPDGKHLAFSAQYDGNTDVYIIPVKGGIPKRLTWHPGNDVVLDCTADGKYILFRSDRSTFTHRHTQLFTVPLEGEFPAALPIPHAHKACYSPDGKRLAYTPLADRFEQWKNYRGGTVTRIWLYSFGDHSVEQIPQPEGRCNDTDPMWIGDHIYFRSDRNGEFNLYSYSIQDKSVEQITDHDDFPVSSAAAGTGKIIYEQAGRLHIFHPNKNRAKTLKIGVAAELLETRPRYVKGSGYIRNANISPSGKRALFEVRGEIITLPAEKGDPRNLTQSTGAHDRDPAWSPDGTRIAYFSDAAGEYELHVHQLEDQNAIKKYKLPGSGFYSSPCWSPDGKKIAYADNSLSYYWINLESGVSTKFGQQHLYGPDESRFNDFSWSPDSNWIAYSLNGPTYFRTIRIYSLAEEKSHQITDGLSDASEPIFDAGGKYLYFLASTDAGPVRQWFDMSNADMQITHSIYLAVLRDDLPSPLAKESDEEEPAEDRSTKEPSPSDSSSDAKHEGESKPENTVRIDFEGLGQRILDLPLPTRDYSRLSAGKENEVYFLEAPPGQGNREKSELKRFSLKTRKAETVLADVSAYWLTKNKEKMLTRSSSHWAITATSAAKPGEGKLNVDSIEIRIDPRAEWPQIYHEAWRINRDYFYAPNYHGADWNSMRDKYAVFLPHLATRSDLNRVIQWLCSELSVGHHRVDGGDRIDQPAHIAGGLLGADYEIDNNRYRFKKIYGGLNWTPELRAPLTAPGVNVLAGDYLLAVEGQDLKTPTNLYSLFEKTADKQVEITVGPDANGKDARTVKIVPLQNEYALRNRDWIEANLRQVDAATGGRVAYVYVPNTTTLGHAYFKRYFFPQADKEAIIVDERFNGGGQVADYYIDLLRKPVISYWAMRHGADLKTPSASIQGPKVMLIDETAGSGGDLLPWMFRKFKLGPLVGKRTWGGLVGILGFPVLMDGGVVTAPDLAIWTEDGWVVENVGVPPDIEVEQWPADVIAGHDPQLEKAIEVIMKELDQNPPRRPERPPYPIRVRR
ncbi:MAG: PD40 domain-containing protein [Pirellulales bacterium]|nr:PD40 domain-containing protein [Pirellulales bacterium]